MKIGGQPVDSKKNSPERGIVKKNFFISQGTLKKKQEVYLYQSLINAPKNQKVPSKNN